MTNVASPRCHWRLRSAMEKCDRRVPLNGLLSNSKSTGPICARWPYRMLGSASEARMRSRRAVFDSAGPMSVENLRV